MMPLMPPPPTRVPHAQLAWLEEQASRWHAEGVIDATTRTRILEQYDAESFEGRSLSALTIVAVLICAIGLLLLIGYNWHRLPASAKVAMIMAAVAAAFGGSAAAYGVGRRRLGETLAFAGTLIFGNAIWLIAQVLHISGRFPDGFLWFGIGALAVAALVRSRWVGTAAAVLVTVWVIAEGLEQEDPPLLFAAIWPATLALGYVLASPALVGVAAVALVPWVVIAGNGFDSIAGTGAMLLAGCALRSVASWHPERSPLARAWQVSGLLAQLVILIPLMIEEMHRDIAREAARFELLPAAVVAILAAAALASAYRARTLSQWTNVGVAAGTVAWILLAGGRLVTPLASTLLFSALALGVGVASIRTALGTGRTGDLVFGVLFTMAFLIVRWVSLVDDMLVSGLLLLATGAGLLFLSRLWRGRDRTRGRAA
jgi:hypothetical protein